jgi:hypothetical protein
MPSLANKSLLQSTLDDIYTFLYRSPFQKLILATIHQYKKELVLLPMCGVFKHLSRLLASSSVFCCSPKAQSDETVSAFAPSY